MCPAKAWDFRRKEKVVLIVYKYMQELIFYPLLFISAFAKNVWICLGEINELYVLFTGQPPPLDFSDLYTLT